MINTHLQENSQMELPLEMEQLSLTLKKSVDSRICRDVTPPLSGTKPSFLSWALKTTSLEPRP